MSGRLTVEEQLAIANQRVSELVEHSARVASGAKQWRQVAVRTQQQLDIANHRVTELIEHSGRVARAARYWRRTATHAEERLAALQRQYQSVQDEAKMLRAREKLRRKATEAEAKRNIKHDLKVNRYPPGEGPK